MWENPELHWCPQILWIELWWGVKSPSSTGSQPLGEISSKIADHAYPDRPQYIQPPRLTSQFMSKALIPNAMDILQES